MSPDELETLAKRFSGDLEKAMRRLACRVQEANSCPLAETFLCELSRCIGNSDSDAKFEDIFLDVAERAVYEVNC